MELKVNIGDKTEIQAAIALLQLALGHSFTTNGDTPHVVDESLRTVPRSELSASQLQAAYNAPAVVIDAPAPQEDAAAIFGGATGNDTGTLPVPFTAGVVPSTTAPVVPPVTSAIPQPGALPHVLPIEPSATAPTVNATPQAGNPAPGGVELDSEGLPWDERIHSSSKAKISSGAWKAKKGINDAALVARVKAELKQRMAVTVVTPPAPQVAGVAPTGAMPSPFVPPAAPSPSVQPVAPLVVADPTTFPDLMLRVTSAMQAGKLPPDAMNVYIQAAQVPSITTLQQAQYVNYIPHCFQWLKANYPTFA